MRKIKRYDGVEESYVQDDLEKEITASKAGLSDNERAKMGIAAGAPRGEESQSFPLSKSVSKPKPKPKAPKPRASQTFPVYANMESGVDVMRRGQASTDGSGVSPLTKYNRDKEADATRKRRKMELAMERVKAGVGYKKGGSVSSASKRADGCAQKGKTKGRMI